MKSFPLTYSGQTGWQAKGGDFPPSADLVLFFGARDALTAPACYDALRARFADAHILGCSTGGQIHSDDMIDDEVAAVAMQFDNTRIALACAPASDPSQSRACGETIARALAADDLAGVFVLSDGLGVNGSDLVRGIAAIAPSNVTITGGMAGDGARFETTLVSGDCAPQSGLVAAVGFYGDAIRIGHGSAGGWDEFGPRRRVTRSTGNVLYELDGEPALDLYKRYLGEEAAGLPGTGAAFPASHSRSAIAGQRPRSHHSIGRS